VRLAHFSDIHVTISPLHRRARRLVSKRATGALNYYVGGRSRHFHGVEDRIARLLEDVDAQQVDHALCTGDITAMSYDEEFERCANLFGDRLEHADRYTVIPGNHDRYTKPAETERRFEKWFRNLACGDGDYPLIKRLGGVTIVGLDVARATSLTDSSGLCGPQQLAATEAILTDAAVAEDFVILALHYGLLRAHGGPDRSSHGLRDYRELMALIDRADTRCDLVLHGHMHGAYRVETASTPVVCAGSATDLHQKCGYNIYDIDVAARTFTTTRRCWDTAAGAYGASDEA